MLIFLFWHAHLFNSFLYSTLCWSSLFIFLQMFILPSLKPLCKLKLTAHEGSRVRRTAMALFKSVSSATPQHSEWCLMCLTNLGDCIVLSTPDLRRQLNAAVIRREDVQYVYIYIYCNVGSVFSHFYSIWGGLDTMLHIASYCTLIEILNFLDLCVGN